MLLPFRKKAARAMSIVISEQREIDAQGGFLRTRFQELRDSRFIRNVGVMSSAPGSLERWDCSRAW
jgi:hypothetical protein